MAPRKPPSTPQPIGETLRARRVEVLRKGLREMAKLLKIAPAHLTDIEKGRRTPSEGLLVRISESYGIPQPELRAGWSKADEVVEEVATQDAMTAEKVPEFLRTARKLSPEQWDRLIGQARRMASGKSKKSEK
jgi:transcriptional regulator with XRE-family HTH domain